MHQQKLLDTFANRTSLVCLNRNQRGLRDSIQARICLATTVGIGGKQKQTRPKLTACFRENLIPQLPVQW